MERFVTVTKKPRNEVENSIEVDEPHCSTYCDPNEDTTKNSERKFRQEWLKNFTWLSNKNNKSYCNTCDKILTNHLGHLKAHDRNEIHLKNIQKKKNQIEIQSCFKIQSDKLSFQKKVYLAELNLVHFLIVHNLPFLLMDYLPDLLRECCPDSEVAKSIKCGRTKATKLAEIIGNKSKEKICKELRTTKFSLITDETTDLSTQKSLVLVVRYVDSLSKIIKDRFLGLIELVKCDAETIYQNIKFFFAENEIPIENLIGLSTDGASVMAGEMNGLQAKLKNDINIFFLKCTCHSLHLCSAYACKKIPGEVEKLCRNIYKFFAYSASRINQFKEFQEYCAVPPHKILGISFTRWLALENVINRVVEQWDALQLYFISCYLEISGIKSCDLANKMGNPETKVYFLFLSYILKIINNLNKEFQSEFVRLPYLHEQIETTVKLILSNFVNNNYIKRIKSWVDFDVENTVNYLHITEVFIGNKAEEYLKKSNLTAFIKDEIKTNALKFYVELLKQLLQRFDLSNNDLKNLSIITPKCVLSDSENSITPLINSFPNLVQGDPEDVINEWKMLRFSKNHNLSYKMDIMEFWEKVSSLKNGLNELCFENLTTFVFSLLTLPHSSAAAERKFFELSLIKTKLRNKLSFENINNIMLAKELKEVNSNF